uniref:Fucolectin tachylectin-4 pentraxin-1 domain-containing protein n=1 Tax=Biomphalaria glabrata TaxID=6526 RepID=A0A2C9LDL7_BIOGL
TWFGPNDTYRCHCDNGCEKDGSQNGVCQKGWFGFKCQYQDLATIDNVRPNQDLDKLTDRNDSTCLDQQNQLLIIQWNRTFVFTWLRIVVNDATLLSYIDVEFTSPSQPSQNLTCDNKRLYLVNQQTLDIKCDVTKEIQSVLISGAGVQSICSLYINGGRNVALRQETWQSSAFPIPWTSSLAVDGNIDLDLEHNSCSHTNNETSPTWSVRFNAQEITRYVLYNRNENRDRLKNFILEGRGPGSTSFSYHDTSDTGEPIYTVLDISKTIVSNVTIIATFDDGAGKYVTLCEVEIYG